MLNADADLASRLAARIRELRLAGRLSQDDVAAHVGVSQPTWSRLESSGQVTVEQLVRLQELLEIETIELFFGELPSRSATRIVPGGHGATAAGSSPDT